MQEEVHPKVIEKIWHDAKKEADKSPLSYGYKLSINLVGGNYLYFRYTETTDIENGVDTPKILLYDKEGNRLDGQKHLNDLIGNKYFWDSFYDIKIW